MGEGVKNGRSPIACRSPLDRRCGRSHGKGPANLDGRAAAGRLVSDGLPPVTGRLAKRPLFVFQVVLGAFEHGVLDIAFVRQSERAGSP